jgi:hypothetical protein
MAVAFPVSKHDFVTKWQELFKDAVWASCGGKAGVVRILSVADKPADFRGGGEPRG